MQENQLEIHERLGEGYDVCPSCKSDNWKSAKMVILEGTSFSGGEIKGTFTQPGALSGGTSNFFLADRWFSLDHKINLGIEFTTSSALIEEIKTFLVAESAKFPEPIEPEGYKQTSAPEKPKSPGILDQVRATPPTPPKESEIPLPPKHQPWIVNFLAKLVGSLILAPILAGLLIWLAPEFSENLGQNLLSMGESLLGPLSEEKDGLRSFAFYVISANVTLVFCILAVISFFGSFSANEKALENYNKRIEKLEEKQKKQMATFVKAKEKYYKSAEALKDKERIYHEEMKQYEAELESLWAARKEFNKNYNAVMKRERDKLLLVRSVIWERTRLCTRCGNSYLGKFYAMSG